MGWPDGYVDLAVDGGAAEVQLASNLRAAELGLYKGLDRDSVSHRDVRVVSSHLGDTLQVAPCCTSKLSRPSPLVNIQSAQVVNIGSAPTDYGKWEKCQVELKNAPKGVKGKGIILIYSLVHLDFGLPFHK
jgi:hypothetical protein